MKVIGGGAAHTEYLPGKSNDKLNEMQRTLAASAQNEYIDLRLRYANDYCVQHHLVDPNP